MLVRIAINDHQVVAVAMDVVWRELGGGSRRFACNICRRHDSPMTLRAHSVDDVIVPRCWQHAERGDLDMEYGSDRLDSVLRVHIKGLQRRAAEADRQARITANLQKQRRDADIRRQVRRIAA